MTDYEALHRIELLPGLAGMTPRRKADALQSLIERSFFHPSGLFYSLLLIDGPEHVRAMSRADVEGTNDSTDAYDPSTREAARDEGMTFENSIASAGLYLQAQAARFEATSDAAAAREARRALASLRMIYDDGVRRGRAGWLGKPYGLVPKDHSTADQYHMALVGLYRWHRFAEPSDRTAIERMVVDCADFMTSRSYQIWDLSKGADGIGWDYLRYAYCNATYVLAQVLAYRLTRDDRYRREAHRLADLAGWRDRTHLDEWREQGLERMLYFERICLGYFLPVVGEIVHELLPELFGADEGSARQRFARMVDRWWEYSLLGIDGEGYAHYWVDVDVKAGTWRPTGVRPMEPPSGWGGTFMSYYSDVRMGDVAYRTLNTALLHHLYAIERRDASLAWARRSIAATDGRRLRWMIDLDGRQLRPDIRWMGCILSSEAPFHYLTVYWRGVKLGLW